MSANPNGEVPYLSEWEATQVLQASNDPSGLPDAVLEAVGKIIQFNRAQAWADGYLRGALDTTSDLEPADNPYVNISGVLQSTHLHILRSHTVTESTDDR